MGRKRENKRERREEIGRKGEGKRLCSPPPETGTLNLQGIEFARKGGGNCKERNIQGKVPQFASV